MCQEFSFTQDKEWRKKKLLTGGKVDNQMIYSVKKSLKMSSFRPFKKKKKRR